MPEARKQDLMFGFADTVPIVRLVGEIIGKACDFGASDMHVDPGEGETTIRFRVDGVLQKVCVLPKTLHSELVARVKILAGLRTDERYMPQDGRFRFSEAVDIRASTVASYYGESIVLRLLRKTQRYLTLEELGFTDDHASLIEESLLAQHGLILVTGPTGSGKTTTLYTLLGMLARNPVSIITVEDPVEYAIKGVRQDQFQAVQPVSRAEPEDTISTRA